MTKYMFTLSIFLSAGAMHAAAGELNKEAAPAALSLAEIAEENECRYYDGIPSPYRHNQRSPDQFKRCMDFKKSEKELPKAIESARPSWKNLFFSRCVASYTIRSGEINTISHSQIPCDQALHRMFNMKSTDWIEDLSIRMANPIFTSQSIECTRLNQAATVRVATELLSKLPTS